MKIKNLAQETFLKLGALSLIISMSGVSHADELTAESLMAPLATIQVKGSEENVLVTCSSWSETHECLTYQLTTESGKAILSNISRNTVTDAHAYFEERFKNAYGKDDNDLRKRGRTSHPFRAGYAFYGRKSITLGKTKKDPVTGEITKQLRPHSAAGAVNKLTQPFGFAINGAMFVGVVIDSILFAPFRMMAQKPRYKSVTRSLREVLDPAELESEHNPAPTFKMSAKTWNLFLNKLRSNP